MDNSGKQQFTGFFGTLVAVGGSVVGLGNIWRFPYLAGENGGAAFLLTYLLISLCAVVPVMLSEFVIGRRTKENPKTAFMILSGKKVWSYVGILGIVAAFSLMSFYCIIAGWSMEYIRLSIMNSFAGNTAEGIEEMFAALSDGNMITIIWAWIFVVLSGAVIYHGVVKGIEKFNKLLMPCLVIILIYIVFHTLTLENSWKGYEFLFHPDFSKITPKVMLAAMSQAFFSMSVGMGCMITYGSYIKNNENCFRLSGIIALSDLSIAILCGMAIFPAVFSYGIDPTSGPQLIFITLPNVFINMTGGYFLSILFFILVFFAAITSSMSLMEVICAYFEKELKLNREKSALLTTLSILIASTFTCLSLMPDSVLKIGGQNLMDFMDVFSSRLMIIGGFFISIFTGWFLDKKIFRDEITNNGEVGAHLWKILRFLVRFVVPVAITALWLNVIGVI